MIKKLMIIPVVMALVLLPGATVWEGAASVASSGELPDTGNFVLTNSFPQNTILEITNLDNGTTVRAIVTSGLDNPGLLAALSREAAQSIGINPRSVGRVRMTQSTDPMVTRSPSVNPGFYGDPDHDPAAMIATAGFNPDLFNDESWEIFIADGPPD